MSSGTITALFFFLLLVAAASATASFLIRRRAGERSLLGVEYDRLANELGSRKAQAEFAKRRQRVDGLGLRSLSDDQRAAYTGQWDAAQELFVDNPVGAVRAAAAMIASVTKDRGYDVTDHEQLLADLSVYHGRYLDGYRRARTTVGRAGQASTEALRQALLGYRVLFFDLLGSPAPGRPERAVGLATGRAAALDKVSGPWPWQQVTQGRRGKARRQEDADSVPAIRS